eukprot:1026890-Pleurochrysis_carterae.AAC.1
MRPAARSARPETAACLGTPAATSGAQLRARSIMKRFHEIVCREAAVTSFETLESEEYLSRFDHNSQGHGVTGLTLKFQQAEVQNS